MGTYIRVPRGPNFDEGTMWWVDDVGFALGSRGPTVWRVHLVRSFICAACLVPTGGLAPAFGHQALWFSEAAHSVDFVHPRSQHFGAAKLHTVWASPALRGLSPNFARGLRGTSTYIRVERASDLRHLSRSRLRKAQTCFNM